MAGLGQLTATKAQRATRDPPSAVPNTPTNLPVGNDRAFLARRSVSLRLVEKAGYRRHRGALATQW